MAGRKKRRKKRGLKKRPSVKLIRQVESAMQIYDEGDQETAMQQLIQLADQYPRSKMTLLALLQVAQETGNWAAYAFYGERLLPMERGDDQAETLNNMVYAYMRLEYSALAFHYADMLVTQHPDFQYFEQVAAIAGELRPLLLDEVFGPISLGKLLEEQQLFFMMEHDRVRFYTESGHHKQAIPAAEALLAEYPDIVPVLNNLSLAQFAVGNMEQAIITSQKALSLEAENCHALGNLVHFTFLIGEIDQAQLYADRLQAVPLDDDNSVELETKRAEGFSFLGEDQRVWAVYERIKAAGDEATPLLLHLAAVAAYRLGNEKKAWTLWRKAVRLDPAFTLARKNLAEKRLPVEKRNIPWYWSFAYWITEDMRQAMEEYVGGDETLTLAQGMDLLLAKRPYFSQLFPHMLERGDKAARDFVLDTIKALKTPDLMQMLHEFALSQRGDDDMRLTAIQFIAQHHPEMLPENRQSLLWIKGKQQELLTLGFIITDEPNSMAGISEETMDKFEEATLLLLDERLEQSERMLQELIDAYPDFPSPYNQLAMVYERQGRWPEVSALVKKTHARFPDYLFASTALASILTLENRTEEARALLQPLWLSSTLHITEFRALTRAAMEVALASKEPGVARAWLALWRSLEEDNPELAQWEAHIDGSSPLL